MSRTTNYFLSRNSIFAARTPPRRGAGQLPGAQAPGRMWHIVEPRQARKIFIRDHFLPLLQSSARISGLTPSESPGLLS